MYTGPFSTKTVLFFYSFHFFFYSKYCLLLFLKSIRFQNRFSGINTKFYTNCFSHIRINFLSTVTTIIRLKDRSRFINAKNRKNLIAIDYCGKFERKNTVFKRSSKKLFPVYFLLVNVEIKDLCQERQKHIKLKLQLRTQ